MPLKINAFFRSPSPHMMDLWEAVHKKENVQLNLFFQEPINAYKPWGKVSEELRVEILHWSAMTLVDQIRTLRRIASVPADVWVMGESWWLWENHILLTFIARRNKVPVSCFVAEPIGDKINWYSRKSSVGQAIYNKTKQKIIPLVLSRFSSIAAIGQWGGAQYQDFLPQRDVFITQYYVNPLGCCQQKILNSDKITLGYCGQLIPRKGLHILLNTLQSIANYNNWELLIAGDGPQRKELENMVPQRLRNRVKFLGFQTQQQLIRFWQAVDILVFPSIFDGWAMVVMEALTAGAPVLSGPNVGAARHYIAEGRNGWIREVDENFLEPIEDILQNPSKISLLSVEARRSVIDYTPETGADSFLRNLNRIVANRARG